MIQSLAQKWLQTTSSLFSSKRTLSKHLISKKMAHFYQMNLWNIMLHLSKLLTLVMVENQKEDIAIKAVLLVASRMDMKAKVIIL